MVKINRKLMGYIIPSVLVIISCVLIVSAASQSTLKVYGDITEADLLLETSELTAIAAEHSLDGYIPAAQSESTVLFVEAAQGSMVLYDKKTQTAKHTVLAADSEEAMSFGDDLSRLKMQSLFVLTAVNTDTSAEEVYTGFEEQQEEGKLSVSQIENGVKITFLAGNIEKEYVIPAVFTEKRFNELASQDAAVSRVVKQRYMKLDINEMTDQAQINEYKEQYPAFQNTPIYILRTGLSSFILEKLEDSFKELSFTQEEKALFENEVYLDKGAPKKKAKDVFRFSINFTLKDNVFSAVLDKGEIKHGPGSIPVYIDILPYFLSGNDKQQGYMFLPDGSGSIMRLNNGKTMEEPFVSEIYGSDTTFPETIQRENTIPSRLPVYGIKTDEAGIFANIVQGEASASIHADISREGRPVNYVYGRFKLRGYKKDLVYQDWTAGAGTVFTCRVQPGELKGLIQIDYYFLPPDKSDYNHMAALYRDILINSNLLGESKGGNKMLLEVMGAFDVIKTVAGVPVDKNIPMTTYNQALEICRELSAKGIPFDMKYLAAVNGGAKQGIANKISFQSELGAAKQYKTLKNEAARLGTEIFLDLSITSVNRNTLFDGFNLSRDGVTDIISERKPVYDKDPVSFYFVLNPKYKISPFKLSSMINDLISSAKKQEISGISPRNMGNEIYSDANPKNAYFRSDTLQIYKNIMQKLKASDIKLLHNGGNLYTLNSAARLAGISAEGNKFRITDQSVPFYQMVVHGRLPYSYDQSPEDDPIKQALLALSTGAALSATVSFKNTLELKESAYSHYYSAVWSQKKAEIVRVYELLKPALNLIEGKRFDYYSEIQSGIFSVGFEDINLLINTTDNPVTADGHQIDSMNYIILRKGEIQ